MNLSFVISYPGYSQQDNSHFYEFNKRYRDNELHGYVFRPDENRVVVEILTGTRKSRIKINRITLTSPSGEVYYSDEIQNIPLQKVIQERKKYLQSRDSKSNHFQVARDWLGAKTAFAESIFSEDYRDRDDLEDAAGFAGFGILFGFAAIQENHWVSKGEFQTKTMEPGNWTITIEYFDEKGKKIRAKVPVVLSRITTSQDRISEPYQPEEDISERRFPGQVTLSGSIKS